MIWPLQKSFQLSSICHNPTMKYTKQKHAATSCSPSTPLPQQAIRGSKNNTTHKFVASSGHDQVAATPVSLGSTPPTQLHSDSDSEDCGLDGVANYQSSQLLTTHKSNNNNNSNNNKQITTATTTGTATTATTGTATTAWTNNNRNNNNKQQQQQTAATTNSSNNEQQQSY